MNRKDSHKILQWNIIKHLLKILPRVFKNQQMHLYSCCHFIQITAYYVAFSFLVILCCLLPSRSWSSQQGVYTACRICVWTFWSHKKTSKSQALVLLIGECVPAGNSRIIFSLKTKIWSFSKTFCWYTLCVFKNNLFYHLNEMCLFNSKPNISAQHLCRNNSTSSSNSVFN